MRRALVLCMVAVAAVATPAAADIHSPTLSECGRITLAESHAREASADIYISKLLPPSTIVGGGSDLGQFLDDVVAAVDEYRAERDASGPEPDSTPLTVQIDIVVPQSDSPPLPGHRVSFWLDVADCA